MGRFKNWLEAREYIAAPTKSSVDGKKLKRYVFFDMDETLVHNIEDGWLKECPGNEDYIPLLVAGEPPYPDIKSIHAEGSNLHIFPRPRLIEFLEHISGQATCFVLTHSELDYANKVIKAYGLGKWIKRAWSARDQEPDSLGKELDLDNSMWVLVDNMPIDSLEMIQKLRILGLTFPESSNPNEEGRRIVKEAKNHFVNVKSWYPTVDEHADNELFRVLPQIREKLGVL